MSSIPIFPRRNFATIIGPTGPAGTTGTTGPTGPTGVQPWGIVSGGISYSDGNVGIKTTTPSQTLDVNGTARIISNKTTVGSLPTLRITDSVSRNEMYFLPNSTTGNYNPTVQNGDEVIFPNDEASVKNNNKVLNLTSNSSTSVGVRITNTSVTMGAGGGSTTPQSAIVFNGSTNVTTLTGTTLTVNNTGVNFTSTTPPTSSQSTIPINDSTSKIPTTAWVQSVISTTTSPVGSIVLFGGITAPAGYLFCDGSTVSQSAYPALFAVLGSTYGPASSGNFTLPDLRSRFPIGSTQINPLEGNSVNGGQTTQSYPPSIYGGNKKLTANQMASHHHVLSELTSNYLSSVTVSTTTATGGSSSRTTDPVYKPFSNLTGINSNFTSTQNQSEFLPPFCSVNYIIKY